MTEERQILVGLAWLALIGCGVRAAIIGWAVKEGTAQPLGRARVVATVFALIAAAGAVALLVMYGPAA